MFFFFGQKLSPNKLQRLSSLKACKVVQRNKSTITEKASVLSKLDKHTAWNILVELEKIDKQSFLEILKALPLDLLRDYLLFEPLSKRSSILLGLGGKYQEKLFSHETDKLRTAVKNKCHIEDLYDLASTLGPKIDSIYRYGDSKFIKDFLFGFSKHDQYRIIVLARCLGGPQVQDVLRIVFPDIQDNQVLLNLIGSEDRFDIEEILKEFTNRKPALTAIPCSFEAELSKSVKMLSNLTVEEAYWVFMYEDEPSEWLPAFGKEGQIIVRFPDSVKYEPSAQQRLDLLTAMRRAVYILHFHNHPELPNALLGPSKADFGFAQHWKAYRPEMSNKMFFYIVEAGKTLRYS